MADLLNVGAGYSRALTLDRERNVTAEQISAVSEPPISIKTLAVPRDCFSHTSQHGGIVAQLGLDAARPASDDLPESAMNDGVNFGDVVPVNGRLLLDPLSAAVEFTHAGINRASALGAAARNFAREGLAAVDALCKCDPASLEHGPSLKKERRYDMRILALTVAVFLLVVSGCQQSLTKQPRMATAAATKKAAKAKPTLKVQTLSSFGIPDCEGAYVVQHVQSGTRIFGCFGSQADAQQHLENIQPMADWSKTLEELEQVENLDANIRLSCKAINGPFAPVMCSGTP